MSLIAHPRLLVLAATLAVPVSLWLWHRFFDDWDDFLECLRYWFQPDWVSLLRGEWQEDWWATLRLLIYLVCCAAIVVALYKLAVACFAASP